MLLHRKVIKMHHNSVPNTSAVVSAIFDGVSDASAVVSAIFNGVSDASAVVSEVCDGMFDVSAVVSGSFRHCKQVPKHSRRLNFCDKFCFSEEYKLHDF